MVKSKKATPKRRGRPSILGRWIIIEMETWAPKFFNEEVQAFFEFGPDHRGSFQFCLVQGLMDYYLTEKDGKPAVEWSWEGSDEMDSASGRGWAVLEEDGKLHGQVFIHDGDHSGFMAKRGRSRRSIY